MSRRWLRGGQVAVLALFAMSALPGALPVSAAAPPPDLKIEIVGLDQNDKTRVILRATNVGRSWSDDTTVTVRTIPAGAGNVETLPINNLHPPGSEDYDKNNQYNDEIDDVVYALKAPCQTGVKVRATLEKARAYDGTLEINTANNTAEAELCPAATAPTSNAPAPVSNAPAPPAEYWPGGVQFRSSNLMDHFIRHQSSLGEVSPLRTDLDRLDSMWRVRRPLADVPDSVSLESINYPGHYLRHQGSRVKLSPFEGSQSFREDATWVWLNAQTGEPGGVTLEASNMRGFYIRHSNYHLSVVRAQPGENMDLYRSDVSFFCTCGGWQPPKHSSLPPG
jgi:hypothetical protein